MTGRPATALPCFTARVTKGAGRGRTIGSPTLNLALGDIPRSLPTGIYACRARWNRRRFIAAMHFGPRPVFADSRACEIHVIDHRIRRAPFRVTVEVVKRLRNIRNFSSVEKLQEQIAKDIAQTKRLLNKNSKQNRGGSARHGGTSFANDGAVG